MIKERNFSFSLNFKNESDSIYFLKVWRKLFQTEGILNEILNLFLLSAVLGIQLQLDCEKYGGYPWQIFPKLPENMKGAILFLIWYIKSVTLKMLNL